MEREIIWQKPFIRKDKNVLLFFLGNMVRSLLEWSGTYLVFQESVPLLFWKATTKSILPAGMERKESWHAALDN